MDVRPLLFIVLIAQLADATTFTLGVGLHGIQLESNSVAVLLYHHAGLGGVLAAKAFAILATLAVVIVAAPRFPRLVMWGTAVPTSFGLLGVLANGTSLLLLA